MFHETENKIEPFHPGFQHLYSNFVYDVNFHFENVIDAISVKSSYFVLRLRFYLLMILVVFCCCCYLTGRSSAEQVFFRVVAADSRRRSEGGTAGVADR